MRTGTARRTVVSLGIVIVLLAGCGPASPSASRLAVRSPAGPSPAASPSGPAASPSSGAAASLVNAVVVTVSDRLRVRSEPRVADDSIKYEPVLPLDTALFVLDGPVQRLGLPVVQGRPGLLLRPRRPRVRLGRDGRQGRHPMDRAGGRTGHGSRRGDVDACRGRPPIRPPHGRQPRTSTRSRSTCTSGWCRTRRWSSATRTSSSRRRASPSPSRWPAPEPGARPRRRWTASSTPPDGTRWRRASTPSTRRWRRVTRPGRTARARSSRSSVWRMSRSGSATGRSIPPTSTRSARRSAPACAWSTTRPTRRPRAGRSTRWVSDRTAGRIKELLSAGGHLDDTRLTLVNAIYLKAAMDRMVRRRPDQAGGVHPVGRLARRRPDDEAVWWPVAPVRAGRRLEGDPARVSRPERRVPAGDAPRPARRPSEPSRPA